MWVRVWSVYREYNGCILLILLVDISWSCLEGSHCLADIHGVTYLHSTIMYNHKYYEYNHCYSWLRDYYYYYYDIQKGHVFLCAFSLKVVVASLKFFLNQSTPSGEDSSDEEDDEVLVWAGRHSK